MTIWTLGELLYAAIALITMGFICEHSRKPGDSVASLFLSGAYWPVVLLLELGAWLARRINGAAKEGK